MVHDSRVGIYYPSLCKCDICTGSATTINKMLCNLINLHFPVQFLEQKCLIFFLKYLQLLFFMIIFVFSSCYWYLRGDERGLGVKINRIVLQTLTFTSGALGIAPANHGSVLLSDSRHGNKIPLPDFHNHPFSSYFFCTL